MTKSGHNRVAVVLAAGQGTRMRSALPKVLHPVGGRPMVEWVIDAARGAGCDRILVVIGHGGEQIRQEISSDDVSFVIQDQQLGTGHALAQSEEQVAGEATLLVLSGDVPLVSAATLEALANQSEQAWAAMAVAEIDHPGSLGRVLATPAGTLERIVEAADADAATLDVRLVNAGMYAFPAPEIYDYLRRLEPDNAKKELYLTDALGLAAADGREVALFDLDDPAESFGVNNRADLARVQRELQSRKAQQLMIDGVTILDPNTTYIDVDVVVGNDTVIHPGTTLLGATRIGAGCSLGQGCWVRDSQVDERTAIEPYSVLDHAEVGPNCRVGPFARLRPGTVLLDGAKVGNFVETKNSRLGSGVKASHLAYIGDAEVGEGSNIGAGTITCNYDGRNKHRTVIGRGAFIGSDTMLVAPVKIGDGAMTGAGSVISKDVPDDSLGVERSTQKNLLGWVARFRKRGTK
jgi:bifunctional UDP-N-acetylglucosamine pyrophosphorylase/glucosamine-1-phosphate N-acetyltransferase